MPTRKTPMIQPPRFSELPRTMLAIVFISAMIVASLWILQPFVPALIWATLVAVSTWPLMLKVQKWMWGKRILAALVMTSALFVLAVVPFALAILTIVEHAGEVSGRLPTLAEARVPASPAWVERVPAIGPKLAAEWNAIAALDAEALHARVTPYATSAARWTLDKAGRLAVFHIHLLLTVIICALLYSKGEIIAGGVRAFARRLSGPNGEQVVVLAGQAIRAVALGVVVTSILQAVLGAIGLAAAGVPMVGFLTALMFVLAIAQIGVAPVLVLAVAWLYWSGEPAWATALLAWTIVIVILNSVAGPLLMKRGADVPLVLIFAGVTGGLLAFGVVGLFVGPVVLAVAYTLFVAWVRDGSDPGQGP